MSEQSNNGAAQFRADLPEKVEQEAVRTTIVGGRPPGSGHPVGQIPRGIEVLLKKAAVDGKFRELLLRAPSQAAETIGLEFGTRRIGNVANLSEGATCGNYSADTSA